MDRRRKECLIIPSRGEIANYLLIRSFPYFLLGAFLLSIVNEFIAFMGSIGLLTYILYQVNSKPASDFFEIKITEDEVFVSAREWRGRIIPQSRVTVRGKIDFSNCFMLKKEKWLNTKEIFLLFKNSNQEVVKINGNYMSSLEKAYNEIQKKMIEMLWEKGKQILSETDQVLDFSGIQLSKELVYIYGAGYRWEEVRINISESELLGNQIEVLFNSRNQRMRNVLFDEIVNTKLCLQLLKWKLQENLK